MYIPMKTLAVNSNQHENIRENGVRELIGANVCELRVGHIVCAVIYPMLRCAAIDRYRDQRGSRSAEYVRLVS